ncbi:helix-turn-helix transcriptional regulator [bacterium]|nr:helix-turn-helix transcriptional regulator [bacterium]
MSNMQDKKLKFQNSLAKIIKKHRQNLQLSMTKTSDEIGLTKSIWSNVEAGNRDPQLTTIWRMAEALNVPLSKIILELENELGEDYFLEN